MRSLFLALFFLTTFAFLQTSAAPFFPVDDLPDLAPVHIREWGHMYRFKRDLSDVIAEWNI